MGIFEDAVNDDRGFLEGMAEDLLSMIGLGWLFEKKEVNDEMPDVRKSD